VGLTSLSPRGPNQKLGASSALQLSLIARELGLD
jgi:hypothetical protein